MDNRNENHEFKIKDLIDSIFDVIGQYVFGSLVFVFLTGIFIAISYSSDFIYEPAKNEKLTGLKFRGSTVYFFDSSKSDNHWITKTIELVQIDTLYQKELDYFNNLNSTFFENYPLNVDAKWIGTDTSRISVSENKISSLFTLSKEEQILYIKLNNILSLLNKPNNIYLYYIDKFNATNLYIISTDQRWFVKTKFWNLYLN